MAWRWVERAAVFDAESLGREAAESAARRRLERGRRRDVAARLLTKVGELLDDPNIMANIPASVGLLASRAFAIHQGEFGSDLTEEQAEEAALLPLTAAAPSLRIVVTGGGEVRKFELPPEGEVQADTGGV